MHHFQAIDSSLDPSFIPILLEVTCLVDSGTACLRISTSNYMVVATQSIAKSTLDLPYGLWAVDDSGFCSSIISDIKAVHNRPLVCRVPRLVLRLDTGQ